MKENTPHHTSSSMYKGVLDVESEKKICRLNLRLSSKGSWCVSWYI